MNISQGSVARSLRSGEILNDHSTANLLPSVLVKTNVENRPIFAVMTKTEGLIFGPPC